MKTQLGSNLKFNLYDMQGVRGFPYGHEGFLYEYLENRTIRDKNTGRPIKREARYVIRTEPADHTWRIDLLPKMGPTEAVYGPQDGASHWATPELAAQALGALLDEIANCSTAL